MISTRAVALVVLRDALAWIVWLVSWPVRRLSAWLAESPVFGAELVTPHGLLRDEIREAGAEDAASKWRYDAVKRLNTLEEYTARQWADATRQHRRINRLEDGALKIEDRLVQAETQLAVYRLDRPVREKIGRLAGDIDGLRSALQGVDRAALAAQVRADQEAFLREAGGAVGLEARLAKVEGSLEQNWYVLHAARHLLHGCALAIFRPTAATGAESAAPLQGAERPGYSAQARAPEAEAHGPTRAPSSPDAPRAPAPDPLPPTDHTPLAPPPPASLHTEERVQEPS